MQNIISKVTSKILFLAIALTPSLLFAQEATAKSDAGTGDIKSLLIQFGVIFFIFYFMLIRPQQKKYKEQIKMNSQLKKGDKVITSSGIIGTVSKAVEGEKAVEIEIASGVKVHMLRSSVTELVKSDKAL